MRIVTVNNNGFFLIKQTHELAEGILNILKRTVVVKMVCLNIGNNYHARVEEHKRTVRLVSFADKVLAVTIFTIGVIALNNAANQKRWIGTKFIQHSGNHRGCSGLAMSSSNRDSLAAT